MKPEAEMTIRERNKRRRLVGWILIYLLLLIVFALSIYWQGRRVNTLGFVPGTIQLSVPKTKFTVGDKISYTLKNGLSKPITLLNNCPNEPLFVYSWTNNSWVRIHSTAKASACINQPKKRVIKAGSSYTQSFADWPSLFKNPGIYRIVALATNYTSLPYADFQVVAKASQPQVRTQVVIQQVITPVYITAPSSDGGGGGTDN